MAKAATLRKSDSKQALRARAAQPRKKPVLKVVKSLAPKPAKNAKAPLARKSAAAVKPARKESPRKPSIQRAAPAPKELVRKEAARKEAPKAKEAPKKAAGKEFRVGHYVVYPTHGVGRIVGEESQAIGEVSLRMLVISFEKDRMTLRVPVNRAAAAGLRHVSGLEQMQKVFITLKSRPKVSRGMWSRRAQEYEMKINSGNVISIAEVVRDLHHNVDQAERSYSERMIYESALSRLVGELAAAEGSDHKMAGDKLLRLLRAHQKAAA
ncbi:MAG: CarD family transcriptional regulator [Alphaproteobacteria bacterium]|nr:CarD family transcriptional regulator [Alphaproteobacteria bacterium]